MSSLISAAKMFVRQFSKDEEGATAIEYGLFAALIAAVIIVAVGTLGTTVNATFETVVERLQETSGEETTDPVAE